MILNDESLKDRTRENRKILLCSENSNSIFSVKITKLTKYKYGHMFPHSYLTNCVPFTASCSCGGSEVEAHSLHPGACACLWHVQLPPLGPLVWRERSVCGLQRKSAVSHRHPGKIAVYSGLPFKPTLQLFFPRFPLFFLYISTKRCDEDILTAELLVCFNASDPPVGGDQELLYSFPPHDVFAGDFTRK